MKKVGLGNISAEIIQDSVHKHNRITSFELEYPRFIHAEFMTHRQFSRNAASSRAIPIEKMHKHISENMAMPVHWGINEAGMQANAQLVGRELTDAINNWQVACDMAIHNSRMLMLSRLHKQIANRVTEPFQMMKTVVTATEWNNFYWLRNHVDAQPEIHELAKIMYELQAQSTPLELGENEWHLPYIRRDKTANSIMYFTGDEVIGLQDAKQVSASCCAQVSYRRLDDSLEKAKLIFDRLINSEPVHASPIEHQATPIIATDSGQWPVGVTHKDRENNLWSGNFKHWIQNRQLFNNHVKH